MEMSMLEPPYCAEPISSSSGNASSVSDGFPELPPLHEALPVIETYFNDFNIALPLHHQPTFMKLLHRCYSGPENQKQRVEYALVHSVLAIGYRLRSGMDDIFIDGGFYPFAENESQLYFRNCERLLNDLVTRDEDTLGVQVLLALVVLHLANGDEKSAAMLISAAMRLAHSLQMHTRTSDDSFPLHEAQQRHNIFWICYIMDKDISLKTSTPSVQLDNDIDLDLPGATSSVPLENMFGITEDENGRPLSFQYLRARVQLAFVEGQIYDNLYSARSLRETPGQRREQVARLDTLLNAWRRSSLPPSHRSQDDRLQLVAADAPGGPSNLAASLHHTYLLCLFSLHGLYSWESVWVQNIDILGRTALENISNKSETCMHRLQLIMGNHGGRHSSNSSSNNPIWCGNCVLFSALVILLVNITYEPGHALVTKDRQLAAEGAALFKGILNTKGDTTIKGLVSVLRGLELAADKWTGYYELDPLLIQPPCLRRGTTCSGTGSGQWMHKHQHHRPQDFLW
ncbi:hypothetical protein PG999_004864 [Apiospora kogelbergensis]|uniref:Xylanolytic transcriptional activator regulatory domain-containing protein n=1 Tax=Apiospora kogelbergensis TaxID=1337665 RepID=A0AAW0R0L5_9PEZI